MNATQELNRFDAAAANLIRQGVPAHLTLKVTGMGHRTHIGERYATVAHKYADGALALMGVMGTVFGSDSPEHHRGHNVPTTAHEVAAMTEAARFANMIRRADRMIEAGDRVGGWAMRFGAYRVTADNMADVISRAEARDQLCARGSWGGDEDRDFETIVRQVRWLAEVAEMLKGDADA